MCGTNRESFIQGLSFVPVFSYQEGEQLLDQVLKIRTSRPTKANEKSSRGHVVIYNKLIRLETASVGQYNLIDTADIETKDDLKINGEKLTKEVLKEFISIEHTLNSLVEVLTSVAEENPKDLQTVGPELRKSTLNMLLAPYLLPTSVKCHNFVLFCIIPTKAHLAKNAKVLALTSQHKNDQFNARTKPKELSKKELVEKLRILKDKMKEGENRIEELLSALKSEKEKSILDEANGKGVANNHSIVDEANDNDKGVANNIEIVDEEANEKGAASNREILDEVICNLNSKVAEQAQLLLDEHATIDALR